MSAVLMFASHAFAWVGLRSYLRWKLPLAFIAAMSAVLTVALLAVSFSAHQAAYQQMLYVGASLVLAALVLRDLARLGGLRATPEFRALTALAVFEGLLLLGTLAWMVSKHASLDRVASSFLLVFLMTKLVRVMVYGALVALRLRQEAEQARQAMTEREAQSHALVDHLGAGVIVFRPDRSVLRVNRAALRFLGWPLDGTPPAVMDWHLLRSDGQPMARHEVPFERVLATGQPVSDFVGGVRAGGEVRWALCNAYPENDLLGGLRHVVFTFVDITALRRMQQQQRTLEQQLAQSQKMEALGTLAGGVAHDFNNILAAILGNADLARQDLAPGAPSRQSLHEISTAARRGRELVRQILAFSRQQPLARNPGVPGSHRDRDLQPAAHGHQPQRAAGQDHGAARPGHSRGPDPAGPGAAQSRDQCGPRAAGPAWADRFSCGHRGAGRPGLAAGAGRTLSAQRAGRGAHLGAR